MFFFCNAPSSCRLARDTHFGFTLKTTENKGKAGDQAQRFHDASMNEYLAHIVHYLTNAAEPSFVIVNSKFWEQVDPEKIAWNDHCEAVIKKVFGILAQLRRSFSFIPPKVRKMLVSSLIFPHIDYASVVFTDMSVTNTAKLQKALNVAVRFITGTGRYDHITPIYRQLNILKVEERRSLAVAKLVWRIFTTQSPPYLCNSYTFTSTSNSRDTRSGWLSDSEAYYST